MQHLARRATACALASGIAHELNQPLSAAAMYLAGARRLLATHPEQAEAGLERAAAQVQRAGAVLRGLRGFLHGGPVRRHEERLGPVVAEALELALSATPGFDRAALTLDSDPGLPPLAMDRVQVQQVVVNLVRNAMEAVTEAPPGPARRIAVTVRAEGSGAAVTIADTGPGLPPSVRARLFEPFVTTRPEGLGLGLSICRTLVEAHGGQIQARAAEAGPGTAFAFTLPRDGGLGTPAAAVA
jgi:two-component system sensor kinase FixL